MSLWTARAISTFGFTTTPVSPLRGSRACSRLCPVPVQRTSWARKVLLVGPNRQAESPFYVTCQSEFQRTKEIGPSRRQRIREIPLRDIRRPLARTRVNNPEKVEDLMGSIAREGVRVPIDVLEVEGTYFGFNGCHRFEACQRLGMETIPCRVIKATREVLQRHLL